eukprot:359116-Chlamydomonas_euryale.AAC.8
MAGACACAQAPRYTWCGVAQGSSDWRSRHCECALTAYSDGVDSHHGSKLWVTKCIRLLSLSLSLHVYHQSVEHMKGWKPDNHRRCLSVVVSLSTRVRRFSGCKKRCQK